MIRSSKKKTQKTKLPESVPFKSFIPGLRSKDCLRIIIEYSFGPDDRLKLKRLAKSLCKLSIQLLEHPNFKQLHHAMKLNQSVTQIFIHSDDQLQSLRQNPGVVKELSLAIDVGEI